jgi:DNA-binding MarR family transcriptional regulator
VARTHPARLPANTLAGLLVLAEEAYTLLIAARLVGAGYDDIRPVHNHVFAHLPPHGIRASELARRAQMTQQAMSELVAYLEEHGYIERVQDASDKRAKIVRLTRRGRELAAHGVAIMREIDGMISARLGAQQVAQLRASLSEVIEVCACEIPAGMLPQKADLGQREHTA